MFSSAPTNQPDGTIRWNNSTGTFQKYSSGSGTWSNITIALAGGGAGGTDAATARTSLGLGSMAVQDSTSASISGGSVAASTLTGTIATARLGSGTANAGTYLRGDQAWAAVPSGVPTGYIGLWGTATAPTDYLLCDGSAVSRTTYSALFSVIGITFGSGNGSTTFNIPDLRGRFPLGKTVSGTGSILAGSGGLLDHYHINTTHNHGVTTSNHTHSGPSHSHGYSDLPRHAHTVSDPGHAHSIWDLDNINLGDLRYDSYGYGQKAGWSGSASTGISIDEEGSGSCSAGNAGTGDTSSAGSEYVLTSANGDTNTGTTNPPYLILNYIIKT